MAAFEFKAKSVAEFVKLYGEAEALGCLKDGARQRFYRKVKNETDKAIRQMVKNDSRFADLVKEARGGVQKDFGVKRSA
jgi:hypothetical protein